MKPTWCFSQWLKTFLLGSKLAGIHFVAFQGLLLIRNLSNIIINEIKWGPTSLTTQHCAKHLGVHKNKFKVGICHGCWQHRWTRLSWMPVRVCCYVGDLCYIWSWRPHASMIWYQINLTIIIMIKKHVHMHMCRESISSLMDSRGKPMGSGTKQTWAQISTLLCWSCDSSYIINRLCDLVKMWIIWIFTAVL